MTPRLLSYFTAAHFQFIRKHSQLDMFVWPAYASSKQAMPTSCVVEAMNSKWKLVLKRLWYFNYPDKFPLSGRHTPQNAQFARTIQHADASTTKS